MNPYITYIIIGITALASYKAFQDGSLKWKLIFNAYQIKERKEWYRFFSHGLIHADWIHFGFNIYVLYVFGKSVELSFVSIFGPVRGLLNYILLYAGALLASSVYSFVKNQDNPHYNALGASGAVSAVLFSYIAMNPNKDLMLFFIELPGWLLGTLYLLYSHYMAKKEMDNIGHDAHFWGAVFGFVVTFVFEPKLFGAFISNFV
ncbi:MAG: rhomboid family intramembrane serine protease [Flavobacteriales bacterium]|nr:rhomboid family intramembrane serine protease [Flavobacteriales bacterium]|tara:strand:- start:9 stop:620 length:612 start_codon:yes stop_codon:yes gene_type:complete